MDRRMLESTKEAWQGRSGAPLTDADAHAIITNVTGFMAVLRRWKMQAAHAGEAAASGCDTVYSHERAS